MLFAADITVPKSTLVTAPYSVTLALAPGRIRRIRVEFPPGCAELVGIQLLRSEHQFWPQTEGEYISWDGGGVESEEEYSVLDTPYSIVARCVNYDSLNAHTIALMVDVQPSTTGLLGSIAAALRNQL